MKKSEELEGRLSQRAGVLSTWQSLLEHPGWKLFEKAMAEQRNARLLVLSEPCSGFSALLPQEFMKGESAGLGLAANWAQLQVEMLKSEVNRLEMQVQLEEHNEAQARSDVPRGRVDSGDWFGGNEHAGSDASTDTNT